ncbi:MAG: hypothetical protein QM765_46370 [Myxococcales bacterium]
MPATRRISSWRSLDAGHVLLLALAADDRLVGREDLLAHVVGHLGDLALDDLLVGLVLLEAGGGDHHLVLSDRHSGDLEGALLVGHRAPLPVVDRDARAVDGGAVAALEQGAAQRDLGGLLLRRGRRRLLLGQREVVVVGDADRRRLVVDLRRREQELQHRRDRRLVEPVARGLGDLDLGHEPLVVDVDQQADRALEALVLRLLGERSLDELEQLGRLGQLAGRRWSVLRRRGRGQRILAAADRLPLGRWRLRRVGRLG